MLRLDVKKRSEQVNESESRGLLMSACSLSVEWMAVGDYPRL
jgi:hypothetical protein